MTTVKILILKFYFTGREWQRVLRYMLYNDFPEEKRSRSQNRSSSKLEKEHVTFIINKLEKDSTLSSKEISNLI